MSRAFLAVLPLLACSPGCADLHWQRAGADAATHGRDLDECRTDARLRARRESWPSMLIARRIFVDARGFPFTTYPTTADTERALLEHDLSAQCMRNKGYELVPAVAPPPGQAKEEG